MQQTKITITKEELNVMQNSGFLFTKATAIQKLKLLLQQLQDEISTAAESLEIPEDLFRVHGKISSGENYNGLPFLILDYPRIFKGGNVFAFRSMFWWGNYFLFTLHLQGLYLDMMMPLIKDNLKSKAPTECFVSTGSDPWQHRLEKNFSPFTPDLSIPDDPLYFKIARKLDLNEWEKVPEYGKESFVMFMDLLRPDGVS